VEFDGAAQRGIGPDPALELTAIGVVEVHRAQGDTLPTEDLQAKVLEELVDVERFACVGSGRFRRRAAS